ncbi:MAG: penicillin-binding protein 2 [Candidatus Nanopelagicaceae bacterium]
MTDRSRLTMVVVQVLIASVMIALLGRLYYMQVIDGERYREAALSVQSRDIVTPANRGLIVDSTGVPMAINRAGLEVTVDRSVIDRLPDQGSSVLRRLAQILKLEYTDVYNRTRLCPELKAGERAGCWNGTRYQPIPITKSATERQAFAIIERSDQFPGVDASPVSIRYYPSIAGENAAHLLGYVGPVTEENLNQAREGSDEIPKYFRNELIGKSGIELQYDDQLRGVPGVRTVIVDRRESVTRQSRDLLQRPGNNLVLNINAKIQAAVERELAASIQRGKSLGRRADSGAAIVMDMKGRVVAIASYPSYDPNIWENGITLAQARRLYSEAAAVPALSRATQGAYAPASTFKVISTAAAIRAGYRLDQRFNCPSEVQIGTRTFRNFDSKALGVIGFERSLALSCDSMWYQIAYDEWVRDGGLRPKDNPNDHFFTTARLFGFGTKTGIDLPSESAGRLPDRAWKKAWHEENKDFYCNYRERAKKSQLTTLLIEIARENCLDGDKVRAGDAVNFSIGQGDVLATPLQIAMMYTALGNGGTLYRPQIAKAIVDPEGNVIREFTPKKIGQLPMNKRTLKSIQRGLRQVVTGGTATGAFSGLKVEVSGKTGTGQVFGRNLDGSAKDDTSWFASYAPAKKPVYSVVMMVSQGGFGGSTSGVGVRRIYEHIFGEGGKRPIAPRGVPDKLPRIDVTTSLKEASRIDSVND